MAGPRGDALGHRLADEAGDEQAGQDAGPKDPPGESEQSLDVPAATLSQEALPCVSRELTVLVACVLRRCWCIIRSSRR